MKSIRSHFLFRCTPTYYQIECQHCDEIVAVQFEHPQISSVIHAPCLQTCPLCAHRALHRIEIRHERYEELMNNWDLMDSGGTTEDNAVATMDFSQYVRNKFL